MKSPAPNNGWSRGKFWMVVFAFFLLQAGLIWAFAERSRKPAFSQEPAFTAMLLPHATSSEKLATALFAEDPTLLLSASDRGFAGRAWLRTPAPRYSPADGQAPKVWLALTNAPIKHATSVPVISSVADSVAILPPHGTDYTPSSAFLLPDPGPASSSLRIEGPLAKRQLLTTLTNLPSQPGVQMVSNTVVQIAVDHVGQVVSSCLIGSSGVPTADAFALSVARRLRFAPAPGKSVAWSNARFCWQTVEPPPVAAAK